MNSTVADELQLVNAAKATPMLDISLDALDRMLGAGVNGSGRIAGGGA